MLIPNHFNFLLNILFNYSEFKISMIYKYLNVKYFVLLICLNFMFIAHSSFSKITGLTIGSVFQSLRKHLLTVA